MKTLAILSFIALSAIVMADLPAHSCTSELRTVMRPINQIYHALEANNFELLNVQYQSFLKAVDSINTVCTPGITKLMFQMRLEGLSCESKLETVLAKVQEFENSDVATDDDIIRISTFILSHMPSLQTLCASKPTEVQEEQVPVVEVAQVEVPEVAVVSAPAVDSIEQPIAYQGFSEDTPAVETVEVAAPQQESVSEDAYALNENELRVIANILPHTPYGQLTVVETPVESAQPEQTAEVSDGLDDLTRTELSMFAGLLSHNEAPSVPAAKPAVDHETLNKVNTKIQNLMGSLMSGSASEEKPVAIQAERVEAPFAGTLQKIHEMIDLQKSKSDSEGLQKVENPTSISAQKIQELIKVLKSQSAAEEGQAQEWKKVENPALSSIQKVQELMGALRSKSDSEELQKVENPSVSAQKAQELINVLKSGSAAEEGQAQEWKKVETSPSSAEKVQELMDILKSGSAPEEELAQELEKVENPKLSEVFSQLIDSIHNQGKTEEVAEAAPVEVKTPQFRPLPGRIGIQIGSKITHQPAQEPVAVAVTETKKTSDDPRPECLSIAYNSLSVLYMFQADAVAQDIKQLESDFKALESITNGINSFCVPTINRDETFSGAGDCPNELQTIKDIISKFTKNGPTNYTNVVDTIQNLWSVHKAFVNDCVNQQETQATQEPVVQVEEAQPELGAIAIQIAPQNDCEVHYSEMIEKLVKMADDAVEENLSEIFKGMGDMRNVINNINRACDVQHRINVFPKGALEKKTCEQDFVNMRSIFANSNMGSLEDLAELTRNVWDACWDLLHDC